MASRDTPRGVSPVLREVCANLLWKRSKAALSYSTQSLTQISIRTTGHSIFILLGVCLRNNKNELSGGDSKHCLRKNSLH